MKNDKKAQVIAFYKTFIEGYILEDLIVLLSIKPDPATGKGGCTVPTAMTIISAMELLGFLLNENGDTKKSKENLYFLFDFNESFLFSSFDDEIKEKLFHYRHGMMHHFFPKFKSKFSGICKDETNQNLFVSHKVNGEVEESLNVNTLARYFIEATEKLKIFLVESENIEVFETILTGLKNIDLYLEISKSSASIETTIQPGTPRNKR